MDGPMDYVMFGLIGLVALLILMCVVACFLPYAPVGTGEVVGTSYQAASVGVGTGVTGGGQVAIVNTYHPRSLTVLVRRDGEVYEARTDDLGWFASLKRGDRVTLLRRHFLLITDYAAQP